MGFSVIPEPAISGFTGPQGPAGTIGSDPVFTGSMAVNDTSGDPNIDIKKNGSMRWKIRSAGTESGSNNGSDLWIESFTDLDLARRNSGRHRPGRQLTDRRQAQRERRHWYARHHRPGDYQHGRTALLEVREVVGADRVRG